MINEESIIIDVMTCNDSNDDPVINENDNDNVVLWPMIIMIMWY